jgi:hypothetical protein
LACGIVTHVCHVVRRRNLSKIVGSADQQRPEQKREKNNMKTLHSFREFGWVVFWVAATIFLFAGFIPTVNRALNL